MRLEKMKEKTMSPKTRSSNGNIYVGEESIIEIPIDRIQVDPNQQRRIFDEQKLRELAESIKKVGLIEPIVVYRVHNEPFLFVIEEGERRYRACTLLGLPTIKAIIVQQKKDKREIQNRRIAENLHREPLSDAELCIEFQNRLDAGQTREQIANDIGKSRGYVSQRLLILKNPEAFQAMQKGELSFVEARAKTFEKTKTPENSDSNIDPDKFLASLQVPKIHEAMTNKARDIDLDDLYNAYTSDLSKFRRVM
jgi:ParB/RepB/Spo0J family partition protein